MHTLLEEYESNAIPDYYNPDLLPHLTTEQIVYYDEMHVKQEGGPLFHNREKTVSTVIRRASTTQPPPLLHPNSQSPLLSTPAKPVSVSVFPKFAY